MEQDWRYRASKSEYERQRLVVYRIQTLFSKARFRTRRVPRRLIVRASREMASIWICFPDTEIGTGKKGTLVRRILSGCCGRESKKSPLGESAPKPNGVGADLGESSGPSPKSFICSLGDVLMSRGRPSLANMQTCFRSRLSNRTDLDVVIMAMDDKDLLFLRTDFVACVVAKTGDSSVYGDVLGSVSLDPTIGFERRR